MSSVKVRYRLLLEINLRQIFYQDLISMRSIGERITDFRFEPTSECIRLMRRLDMVFKPSLHSGGFQVWAGVWKEESGVDYVRNSKSTADKLSFWIVPSNPDVYNFNDLPAEIDLYKNMLYLSNMQSDGAAPRDNLHLTGDGSGAKATDFVKTCGVDYNFIYAGVALAANIRIKHLLSGITIAPTSADSANGKTNITANLSSLPIGKCKLLIGSTEVDEFYYYGSSEDGRKFGVIELSLTPSIPTNYRIVESNQSLTDARPRYTINLINRKTRWRYTLQLQTNSSLYQEIEALPLADKDAFINAMNIVSNDGAIVFTRQSASARQYVFVSNNVIDLKEQYFSSTISTKTGLRLTLKKYVGDPSNEKPLKENLPFPSITMIDARNNPTIYSDVLITL